MEATKINCRTNSLDLALSGRNEGAKGITDDETQCKDFTDIHWAW